MPWPFYAGKLNSMQTRQRAIVGNIGLVVGAGALLSQRLFLKDRGLSGVFSLILFNAVLKYASRRPGRETKE
jgi:hypothetical protein